MAWEVNSPKLVCSPLYRGFITEPNLLALLGFVGISNLALSGLVRQVELNVDVLDHDATGKLADWFKERWTHRWCADVTEKLADLIGASWALEDTLSRYLIYLKIAYHLSRPCC
jgi:hypothetical protein